MTNESTASSVAQNFKPDDKLAGCYSLKEILPFEGPGVVWLVRDEELNKDLTLHFLPDSVVADSRAMSEIKQETKRNRQIVHPRILRVHDLIEEDGWAAITMDHVDGDTLASLKKQKEKGLFNVSEIAPWMGQLCQTLEDAHKIDLLHRDLAPENLLITKSGLTVMNFGISRAILDSLSRSGQKVHGDGNLAYMSPQQLDGEKTSKWDDIYSLGAVVYDLLTSRPPFYNGELITQIRKAVPPPMRDRRQELGIGGEPIPRTWEEAVAACLEKHTAQRPKNVLEVAAKFAADSGVGASGAYLSGDEGSAAKEADAVIADENERGTSLAQKKEWGPSKTPFIAEATVVSQTSVEKEGAQSFDQPEEGFDDLPREAATERSSTEDRRGGPTTPSGFPLRAFVGVDEGKSGGAKPKIPLGALAAVVAVIAVLGIAAYMMTGSEKKGAEFTPGVTQVEPAQNVSTQRVIDKPVKTSPSAPPSVAISSPAVEKVRPPQPPPVIIAKNNPTPTPVPATPTPTRAPTAVSPSVAPMNTTTAAANSRLGQAAQTATEKARAAEAARQQLAAIQQAQTEKAKAAQAAQASLKEVQDAVQQKLAAATTARKSAEDAVASQKSREDAQKKAELDAEEAQKAAAEKARLAAEARKAATDSLQTVKQQQALAQRADADAQELQRVIAERQRISEQAAKVAADGDAARKQTELALKQTEADAAAAEAEIERLRVAEQAQKNAEEADKTRVARETQLKRIAEQATLAAKAAADAQKALQDAQRQFEEADKAREQAAREAASAAKAPLPMAAPVTSPSASAAQANDQTLALQAQPASKTPSLTVGVPKAKLADTLENGLGMKFASVGGVLMSVWQTRVQDFNAFAKAAGTRSNAWMQPGFKQGPDHPVVNVSWNDAMAFCKWLTDKEHKEGLLSPTESYRLPTDLEWSKAVGLPDENGRTAEARDMDVPDLYPWGTQWPPPKGTGNFADRAGRSRFKDFGYIWSVKDGFATTSPVGSFLPNRYGLYDMSGNVWQWCEDWLDSEHKYHVLRGGSWRTFDAERLFSSHRGTSPDVRDNIE
ncbi:MAG: eukaryotic-like serine/threonine-protein kinase, partial [Chthoniobacter sp.]|nr:eukaryotic-like serine/threonine-protein kinase [Chthoniobacter sp.]